MSETKENRGKPRKTIECHKIQGGAIYDPKNDQIYIAFSKEDYMGSIEAYTQTDEDKVKFVDEHILAPIKDEVKE